MGLDISKINNAELKKLAYLKDADNNMHLEGQEFIDFKTEAAGRPDVSAEDFNQAMGLYVTNPAQATVAEPVATSEIVETQKLEIQPAVETKKDAVVEDKAKDEISKNRKKAINATCDRYLNELYEEGVSREDLIAKFDEKVGAQKDHPEYRAYRGALVDVLSLSQSYEYKTLDDINKFSKEIKATLRKYDDNDEVHKSILKIVNNIIDNEIRIKALEDVEKNYYDKIVEEDKKAGRKRNNAEIMEEVRDRLYQDKKFTGDEYRTRDTKGNAYVYAFCHFRNTDIMDNEVANLDKAIVAQNSEDQTNWRDVSSGAKEDLKEEGLYSYLTRRAGNQKVGPDGDEERRIKRTSKNQARSNNVKAHKFQTEEEILAILGNKSTVYEALLSRELITKTENGEYDLTELQKALKEPIGFDNNWNKHIKGNEALSERLNAITKMAHETGLSSLKEEEVEKLVELCGYGIEKTGWNWGKALLGAILGGVGGAVASATGLATTPVKDGNNVNNLNLKITCNGNVSVDTSKLPAEIADAVVQNGSEILINLSKVKPGADAVQILMAMLGPVALKTAAITAALGLLNGIDRGGEISVASTSFGEKDYGKYIEKIKDRYPEYVGILESIALNFVENGKWNYEGYYNFLDEMAGRDSVLNWDELDGGLKALKANAQTEDTGNKDDVATKKVYVADKAAVEEEGYNEAVMADVPTIDGRKTSWTLITEMYPCLATKYKSLSDRIRVLKLTQAINNGNYTKERLDELLALSKKGLSAMKNIEGFDYEVYKKVLLDGVISTVKVPDELAGCKREQDQAANAEKSEGGTGTGGYAPDRVKIGDNWVQTKPGSDAVYALRVEGENVKVFTTMKDRDDEYAKIVNENKGVTVEKIEVDYSKIKEEQIQE